MTEEEKQERNRRLDEMLERFQIKEERNNRRYEEEVRGPMLQHRRRRLGVPEPKITIEQAIEITQDYFINVEGYPENFRKRRLLVTSELQHYQIWPLDRGTGFVKVKVDMIDGSVYDVIAPDLMM